MPKNEASERLTNQETVRQTYGSNEMNQRNSWDIIREAFKWVYAAGVAACLVFAGSAVAAAPKPKPTGKLVDLGGHKLHVYCTGRGSPTVVVENGLGDFSFDWILVQNRVSRFTRICTYDRAGYAWSRLRPQATYLCAIES
jgi:hypothetical protein